MSGEAVLRALRVYDAAAAKVSHRERPALVEPMRVALRDFALTVLGMSGDGTEAPIMRMSVEEVVDWGFKKMAPLAFVAFASERSSPSCQTVRGCGFWQRVAVLARKRTGLLPPDKESPTFGEQRPSVEEKR